MVITKDKIFKQVQQDSAAYDALSDALKDVLSKEIALVRGTYSQSDRMGAVPHMVGQIRAM